MLIYIDSDILELLHTLKYWKVDKLYLAAGVGCP